MEARYEGDILAWSIEQAASLRARRITELDIDNIAEEIEDYAGMGDALTDANDETHLNNFPYQPVWPIQQILDLESFSTDYNCASPHC